MVNLFYIRSLIYNEVDQSNPCKKYGNIIPEKLECVGHVQKSFWTKLRNLVKELQQLYQGRENSQKRILI